MNKSGQFTFASMILRKLIKMQNITRTESSKMLKLLLNKSLEKKTDFTLGAFLTLLQAKGPTMEEIKGLVDALKDHAKDMPTLKVSNKPIVATVGSGKDQFKTINITTAAAIIAASCGATIVKIGCSAESSVAGTTDILEFLGFSTRISYNQALKMLKKFNFGFFNPEFPLPKLFDIYIGKSVVFNPIEYILSLFLGVKVRRVLYGLSDPHVEISAQLLHESGHEKSMVVCGTSNSGLYFDEISNLGTTIVAEVTRNGISTYQLEPENFGIKRARDNDIKQPETLKECAEVLKDILKGKSSNAHHDIVAINAGALLWLSNKCADLKEGTKIAIKAIEEGRGWDLFTKILDYLRGELK